MNSNETCVAIEQEALENILKDKKNRIKYFIQDKYNENDRILKDIAKLNEKSSKIEEEISKVTDSTIEEAIKFVDEEDSKKCNSTTTWGISNLGSTVYYSTSM